MESIGSPTMVQLQVQLQHKQNGWLISVPLVISMYEALSMQWTHLYVAYKSIQLAIQ